MNQIFHIQGDRATGKSYLLAQHLYKAAVEERYKCAIGYRNRGVLDSLRADIEAQYVNALTKSSIHGRLIFRRNEENFSVPLLDLTDARARLAGWFPEIIYLQDENWTLYDIQQIQRYSRGADIV